MSDFEIRMADEGDRQHVIRLMGNVYARDMAGRYDWLYKSNPHGRALTWLAIECASGEAVGCTSLFPRKVFVDGCERIGSIGGDCYIEPRVRRQGLATRLHLASFAGMRASGIEFMYGPPTPNNLGALVKAGSHLVTGYRRWVRPLTSRGAYRAAFSRVPTKFEARLAGLPIMVLDRLTRTDATGFALEQVYEFGPEFSEMFCRAAATHRVACARDEEFMTWKYHQAPSERQVPLAIKHEGRIEGFVALERCGEYASIVDIFCANDSRTIDAVLQLIIEHATADGCSSLEMNMTAECAIANRLLRHGFIKRGERGFQVALADADSPGGVLLAADSWHFTEADQDMDTVFMNPAGE
ncbi:MAG: GNAT family N-acetyltransferase [Blastocatellia bacterium]